jgi:hypothetical protein
MSRGFVMARIADIGPAVPVLCFVAARLAQVGNRSGGIAVAKTRPKKPSAGCP